MAELAGRESLGVHVARLLDLQRELVRDRHAVAGGDQRDGTAARDAARRDDDVADAVAVEPVAHVGGRLLERRGGAVALAAGQCRGPQQDRGHRRDALARGDRQFRSGERVDDDVRARGERRRSVARERDEPRRREHVDRVEQVGGTAALRQRHDAGVGVGVAVEARLGRRERESADAAPAERERAEHPDEQRAPAAEEQDVAPRDRRREALRAVRRGDAAPHVGLLADLRLEVRAEQVQSSTRRVETRAAQLAQRRGLAHPVVDLEREDHRAVLGVRRVAGQRADVRDRTGLREDLLLRRRADVCAFERAAHAGDRQRVEHDVAVRAVPVVLEDR